MSDPELERLAARVDALEREVAQLKYGFGAAPAAPAPPPRPAAAPVSASAPPAAPKPPAPPRERHDVESLVGGRGLLYVGAFLVVVAVAFFLKIAFDRGWIGPSMRVALGIIAGAVLIAGGQALRKRLHSLFADTIVGMGGAIEYLALFGAGALFNLVPVWVVFVGTIVVTGTLCVIAYRDNRQPLAHLGIVGGLISPLLLGASSPNPLTLFTYLGVLGAGSIALGELRKWKSVPIVGLCGTAMYWIFFNVGAPPPGEPLAERIAIAVVLYAIFASTTVLAWRRQETLDGWQITVSSINAVWFFLGMSVLAYHDYVPLAIVFLAIAAAHLVAGRVTRQRAQFWMATIAITFAVPPICWSFEKTMPAEAIVTIMHVAWIVEATVFGVLGTRWKDRVLYFLSGGVFAAAFVHWATNADLAGNRFLLNERFITLAGIAIGMAIVRRSTIAAGAAGAAPTVAKIVVDVVALMAISPEAFRLGQLLQPHNADSSGLVAISVVWALYAVYLIVSGIRAKSSVSRWEGLGLLGITVLKFFLLDLTGVDLVFRVISALVLGVVMLVLAYVYQSRMSASKETT